jgi:hypothetical protein
MGLLDRDDPESSPRAAETATLADVLALAKTFRYDYVFVRGRLGTYGRVGCDRGIGARR